MDKREYLTRTREFAVRGENCNHSKLTTEDVEEIRSAARQRERLRQYINDNLTNSALAEKFGVSVRTVEKVLSYESWRQEE